VRIRAGRAQRGGAKLAAIRHVIAIMKPDARGERGLDAHPPASGPSWITTGASPTAIPARRG